MSLGSVSPFSTGSNYSPLHASSAAPRRQAYGYGGSQFGAQNAHNSHGTPKSSGGGIFSTLWKGAVAIGACLLGFKFLKPEFLWGAASKLSEKLNAYAPTLHGALGSIAGAFKAGGRFAGIGSTVTGWLDAITNAFRGVFGKVSRFFKKPPTREEAATTIQRAFRGSIPRKQFNKIREGVVKLQRAFRSRLPQAPVATGATAQSGQTFARASSNEWTTL